MTPRTRTALVAVLLTLLAACGNPNQRLDEHIFHDGPGFTLKVVRYYRNIPFNALGEHAVVMCRSDNTARFPAHDQQDAGWRMLGSGDARGDETAARSARRVRDDYIVYDDHTLIATVRAFNISFDACGHFINWDPARLPPDLINEREKPDSCAPNGRLDCRYYDFEDDYKPRYDAIQVKGDGQVSFTVRTPALRDIEALRVSTDNNGVLWQVETVRPGDDGTRALEPARLRALPVSALDDGQEDTGLAGWLGARLPARSMVIWPDALTACGEHLCAEIFFSDSAGNSGSLALQARDGTAAFRFRAASYGPAGNSRPLQSLSELGRQLAAAAREQAAN